MDRSNGGDRGAAAASPEAEALEFVRFCHRRKHVGWPELYDEMCAVAGKGLYRGYGTEELSEIGIGFGLFQMPALAGLVSRVVAEDLEHRRRLADAVRTVVAPVAPTAPDAAAAPTPTTAEAAERPAPGLGSLRIAVPAGA